MTRAAGPGAAAARHAVVRRVAAQREEIARRTLARFATEIVGWQALDADALEDARQFVLRNIDALAGELERDEPVPEALLADAREVAARRMYQGISIEGLSHQGRLWGETQWEAVLEAVHPDRPAELEAALEIGGPLWRHVDIVSGAMAHAYIDEASDRGLLGRELLDRLLAGQGDEEAVHRLARVLHRRLGESHVVVRIRADGTAGADGRRRSHSAEAALDEVVQATRTQLCPSAGSLTVGIRQGDVVALYPVTGPEDLPVVAHECASLADGLTVDVSIGMSGWHGGRPAIATAYAEAGEAVEIAAGTGIRGRAVALADVLIDHMLRASPFARRILEGTLEPLVRYDAAHRSELVPTLRAYIAGGTSLTRTAAALTVHPNTVVYRLRRIRELSGRDPHATEDLQILFLALKVAELSCVELMASDGS